MDYDYHTTRSSLFPSDAARYETCVEVACYSPVRERTILKLLNTPTEVHFQCQFISPCSPLFQHLCFNPQSISTSLWPSNQRLDALALLSAAKRILGILKLDLTTNQTFRIHNTPRDQVHSNFVVALLVAEAALEIQL